MLAKVRDDLIRQMFESDMDLLLRKGHDYSGEKDCLKNLREYSYLGILVRLHDKLARLKSLWNSLWSQHGCLDEPIQDTLRDMSNYCYLARVLLWEQKQKEEDEVHEE